MCSIVVVTENIFNPQSPAANTLPLLVIYDLVLAADVEDLFFLVLILLDGVITVALRDCVDSPAIRLRTWAGVTNAVLNP